MSTIRDSLTGRAFSRRVPVSVPLSLAIALTGGVALGSVLAYPRLTPTAETSPIIRERTLPPESLDKATIGLLSISKERSAEFLDSVERELTQRGLKVLRFTKPTHTKLAPEDVIQNIVEQCDVVVEGLAD